MSIARARSLHEANTRAQQAEVARYIQAACDALEDLIADAGNGDRGQYQGMKKALQVEAQKLAPGHADAAPGWNGDMIAPAESAAQDVGS